MENFDGKNTMHLFAGGGGGLLSDLITGHNPICAVEWETAACAVLRERAADGWFPDLFVYEGDVRLFDPSEYAGRIHTLCAGFPCQDISVAGKQAGVGEETRSGLYREVLRIADVVRPEFIFMENVSAILSNGLGTVLADLASRGYDARWICLRASDVGANHHRDRWWLLARRRDIHAYAELCWVGRREQQLESISKEAGDICHPKHAGQPTAEITGIITQGSDDNATEAQQAIEPARPGEQCADVAYAKGESASGLPIGTQEKSAKHGISGEDVPNSNAERLQRLNGSAAGRESSEAQRFVGQRGGNEPGQAEPSFCRMDDGLAFGLVQDWWEIEPEVGRVTSENDNRAAQLKMLGNGQVPLQSAVARIMLEKLF